MKKILLTMVLALTGIAGAFAQQAGRFGAGINLGVAPVVEGKGSPSNFLLGGRVQYSFTDMIRGNVDLNYGFEDKAWSTFDATANANFMIPVSGGFYVYPLAGIGVGNVKVKDYKSITKFVFNVGIGCEYEFTKNIAAGLEFKYRYMKDYEALPVLLNVSYKF